MSPTYIVAVVTALSAFLRLFHVEIGSEQLTTTVITIISIAGPLFIALRHWVKGNTTLVGTRPK